MTLSSATIISGIAKNAAWRAPSWSNTMIGSTVVGNNATSAATWLPAANERQCVRRPEVDAAQPSRPRDPPTSWRRMTRLATVATATAAK